ncbi:unnamed protein product [Nippostrongylus brasiliensis]|uniref:guanylate cyclase n=1 Tax=Nippostrongylus brasiliensis TaxID=27835 RepID=A0A158QYQ3_NIPBR|nr:unnamed protein product [Nippostrongylus brasiliensis]
MYHLQKVKVFIGPYCNAEMDAVARMAAFWNIPIIGYMAASNSLSDKKAYPTLARVSLRTTNSIAEATCALLRHYGWYKIVFDEWADAKAMLASESSREFLTAANSQGMAVNEYAYVLPWLQDGAKDTSPWIAADGSILQKVKDQYANTIIVDDVNSFDNSIIQPFLERIKEAGLSEADVDIANIYGYLYLFDSLKLYAIAAKKVMNETGGVKNVVNGRLVWNTMRRLRFSGMLGSSGIASGVVTMDDRGERAPLYRGFFVSPNSEQVLPMVHLEPTMIKDCDGDEPSCGFRGERCDFTLVIVGGVLVILLLLAMASIYFIRRLIEKRALDKLPFRIYRDDIQFIDEEQLKSMMKQAIHDNINPFLGIAFNEKEEVLILGLEYLHASAIGYHGALSTWSCLIDRNWMIKLTDYGIADPLERWEKQQAISVDGLKDGDDKTQALQATSALYEAPEMLKNREKNRLRRNRKQLADIYAFGVVMYEIFFRALPFPEGTDISELVEAIKDGSKVVKPTIQKNKVLNMDLTNLIEDCWNGSPEMRPSLRRIKLNVETYLKVRGSLVDQMMRMMEEYANNLERTVQERTGMLEEANVRADKLLSQLLPAYVASELKQGRSVPPKMFSSATILFSDIVGFADLCQSATPLEVVNVLNGVFDGFDQFIARRDAYKYLTDFAVPHKPRERIVCRLGFHTGPVAAAVVGLNAPRYCLFGDTVNMSSRMESNSEPGKTQISEAANKLLLEHYPDYETEERGQISVKGKGMCTTYWLLGVKQTSSNTYQAPTSQVKQT